MIFSTDIDILSLQLTQDAQSALVRLEASDGSVLLESTYFSLDGAVRLTGLTELINAHLRKSNRVLDVVKVFVDGALAESHEVLHADRVPLGCTAEEFVGGNFLTTNPQQRHHPLQSHSLTAVLKPGESSDLTLAATVRNLDTDELSFFSAVFQGAVPQAPQGAGHAVAVYLISQQTVNGLLAAADREEGHEVISFTASVGGRSASFYLDRSAHHVFAFTNAFNAPETAAIRGSSAEELESKVATADTPDGPTQYDARHSLSHKFVSDTLLHHEAQWLTQLLASPMVKLAAGEGAGRRLLISDHSAEFSPNAPASLKFSWRLANNRAALPMPAPSRVFTPEFNRAFS